MFAGPGSKLRLAAPAGAPAVTPKAGGQVEVVEFYNAGLQHYFISADPAEIAVLDGGAFGGAWKRTGNTFPGVGRERRAGQHGAGVPLLRHGPVPRRRLAHRPQQPLLHGGSGRMRVREDGIPIACRQRGVVSGVDLRIQCLRSRAARGRHLRRRVAGGLPHVQRRRARRSQPPLLAQRRPAAGNGRVDVRRARDVRAAGDHRWTAADDGRLRRQLSVRHAARQRHRPRQRRRADRQSVRCADRHRDSGRPDLHRHARHRAGRRIARAGPGDDRSAARRVRWCCACSA